MKTMVAARTTSRSKGSDARTMTRRVGAEEEVLLGSADLPEARVQVEDLPEREASFK